MKRTLMVAVALASSAVALSAQTPLRRPEIRPFAGALIAIGDQQDLFKNATMFGGQLALEMNPNFHFVGTFGYSSLTSKYNVSDAGVQAFLYDVGVEIDRVRPLAGAWQFKPFIGVGGGGRSYSFKDGSLKDRSVVSGYATLGTEFQLSRLALRIEARDNVFNYHEPTATGGFNVRNDVALGFGLAYHIR